MRPRRAQAGARATSTSTRSRKVGSSSWASVASSAGSGRIFRPQQRAAELAVVVAEQEQAATFVEQPERQAQRADAVGAVVGEVAELDHEAVGLDRMREGADIAVHVAHDAQRRVGRHGRELFDER